MEAARAGAPAPEQAIVGQQQYSGAARQRVQLELDGLAPRDIADVKVDATMMDGKFTYQAKDKVSQYNADRKYAQFASAEFFRFFYH